MAYNEVVKQALREQVKKKSYVEERPLLKAILLGGGKKAKTTKQSTSDGYLLKRKK